MKKKDGDLIYGFFRERFGGLVADELVEINLKKIGVTNFENIPFKEQIEIGKKIIESVSGKFYSTDRIENLKTLYLLRFSLKKASEKVQLMIRSDCDVSIQHPKSINLNEIDEKLKIINNEKNINFCFEFSDSLEGVLMITLPQDQAIELAKLLIVTMLDSHAQNNEMNDMKKSAIQEFFSMLLPAFSEVIAETFNENLFYTPLSFDQFKSKFYFDNRFIIPTLMIHTKTKFNIKELDSEGDVFLFIKDATGRFKALMNQSNVICDPFDRSPPTLLIKPSGDILSDVRLLFKMLNIHISEVDSILKYIRVEGFKDFTSLNFDHFVHHLVKVYLKDASENKKHSVKVNLQNVISIKQ